MILRTLGFGAQQRPCRLGGMGLDRVFGIDVTRSKSKCQWLIQKKGLFFPGMQKSGVF